MHNTESSQLLADKGPLLQAKWMSTARGERQDASAAAALQQGLYSLPSPAH